MKRMPGLFRGLALVSVLTFPITGSSDAAWADVIRLKDGTRVEGDISKTDDGWMVIGADGKATAISSEQVASIEARPKSGADVSEDRLFSLRRAVDNIPDIRQVISRYRSFITQFAGTTAALKAKGDLLIWQDRLDRNLIRVGDRWMTRDEKAGLMEQSNAKARDALELVRQAKLHDAAVALDQIIVEYPQSAGAWYLKGVVLYRQDQLTPARKAFEAVINLLPDHVPSLNNIAVIYFRQNQQVTAANFYDKALVASPKRQEVLDNVAEALDAFPATYRDTPITKKLVRHFNEQDTALQADMQKRGLYRWGATWVQSSDLERLKDAEKQIQAKIDKLSGEYDAVTERINRIDVEVDSDRSICRRMDAESYGRDPTTGATVRYPLPPSYYGLVHDIQMLQVERDTRVADQDKLRLQARQLKQSLPTPKYSGMQKIIDLEGAPIPAAPPPAPVVHTDPAALPAIPPAPASPATRPVPSAQPPQTQPAPLPRHTVVPPPKPSIMDGVR